MKEIKSIIYETVDGTLFTDKKEAEKHEKRLLGRRFFRVYAHPDLTEGRHDAQPIGYIMVDAENLSYGNGPISDNICEDYAEAWCELYICSRKYSFAACSFHRGGPFHNWKVEQISEFNRTDIKNSSDNYLGSVDENGFHSFIK